MMFDSEYSFLLHLFQILCLTIRSILLRAHPSTTTMLIANKVFFAYFFIFSDNFIRIINRNRVSTLCKQSLNNLFQTYRLQTKWEYVWTISLNRIIAVLKCKKTYEKNRGAKKNRPHLRRQQKNFNINTFYKIRCSKSFQLFIFLMWRAEIWMCYFVTVIGWMAFTPH